MKVLWFITNIYSITHLWFNMAKEIKKVRARHILVSTIRDAKMILEKLNEGVSFTTLAKKYSKCPSKKRGGDMGYFERGQMAKPFEDAAFSLKKGEMSGPVRTQFGYHIIKVMSKR